MEGRKEERVSFPFLSFLASDLALTSGRSVRPNSGREINGWKFDLKDLKNIRVIAPSERICGAASAFVRPYLFIHSRGLTFLLRPFQYSIPLPFGMFCKKTERREERKQRERRRHELLDCRLTWLPLHPSNQTPSVATLHKGKKEKKI